MEVFDFYSEWKTIRNWFKNFWVEEIVDQSIQHLHQCWGKTILEGANERLASPWISLLVLKWGSLYGSSKVEARKSFGPNEFSKAYTRILNLPAQLSFLGAGDSLSFWRFVRASFVGQFHYQNNAWFYGLAVLETILKDIGIDYQTDLQFKSCVGMELEEFLSLQVLICGGMLAPRKNLFIKAVQFRNFTGVYSAESIDVFLNFISLDHSELQTFLEEGHRKIKNPEYEQSLFSPLYQKPFLRVGEKYYPYHQALLQHHVDYGVYDVLKKSDPGGFSGSFGYGFEKYVEIPLRYSGIKIFREDEVKNILHEPSVSDYAMIFGHDALLVEVKSAEMYPLLLQNPTPEMLKKSLRTSIIKGYQQLFRTAYKMKALSGTPLSFSEEAFGLIVTFKPLFLGPPNLIWEEFMESCLREALSAEILDSAPLNSSHIFCLSVYELDVLCAHARDKGKSLVDCLKVAVKNNEDRETASFMFVQHLKDRESSLDSFPHIKSKFDSVMERLRESYREDENR